MSAAKMVADSTQSDIPEKSSTKRKKSVERKKTKKKKIGTKKVKKKDKDNEEDYDESDLDLENDIQPLGAFIKDRARMLEEMFHCVRGASLQRALPDVLKELTTEELKQRCLEQLEVMSKKRIGRIMAGDDPATISSSGTEDESSEDEKQADPEDGEIAIEQQEQTVAADSTSHCTETGDCDRDWSLSDKPEEGEVDNEETSPGESVVGIGDTPPTCDQEEDIGADAQKSENEDEEEIGSEILSEEEMEDEGEIVDKEGGESFFVEEEGGEDKIVVGEGQEMTVSDEGELEEVEEGAEEADMSISDKLCEEVQQGSSAAPIVTPARSIAPVLTKNQMELLELEMRARAIKAMLKSQDS